MDRCSYCGSQKYIDQKFCNTCGSNTNNVTKLSKNNSDKMIAGVCSGLAKHYNTDPTVVRIIFILFTLMGGSGILLYVILFLVIPDSKEQQLNY